MPFRSPFNPPTPRAAPARTVLTISFRHPAYPDSDDAEILLLSAVDGDDNSRGIEYDTAFVACCIVTGNKWSEGWLAQKPRGTFERVKLPEDGILRGRVYYFMLGEGDSMHQYPVHPSFDHWRFPHDDLPLPWRNIRIPPSRLWGTPQDTLKQKSAAAMRDATCRISGYRDGKEVSHLLPAAASLWFNSNSMKRYTRYPSEHIPSDDEQNLLILRRDLHHLFDQRRLIFAAKSAAPKDGSSAATSSQLVLHVLLPDGSLELVNLYQDRIPQEITGISAELLFARFAWSIFTDNILTFFRGTPEYSVLLYDPEYGKQHTKRLHAHQIRNSSVIFGPASRSRSVSPRKRTTREVSQQGDSDGLKYYEQELGRAGSDSSVVHQLMGSGWDEDSNTIEEPRGRRRKRDWSPDQESIPSLSRSAESVHSPPLLHDPRRDESTGGDQISSGMAGETMGSDSECPARKRFAGMMDGLR